MNHVSTSASDITQESRDDRSALLDALRRIVGDAGILAAPEDTAPFLVEPRGIWHGAALAVVRPASTAEVAAIVSLCAERGVPVTPQGGNTGLCGGATPAAGHPGILLSLSRMNRVLAVDPDNFTITVQAGCVLADVQTAAASHDRLFPLSLGAQGSCQVGGNLSTNAGGIHVLRYGNMRDLALGLEVVLPDGRVWNGLRALRKDNTGYDLKHWFIGAEGTLGIITAATLKLFPRPTSTATALAALSRAEDLPRLLALARSHAGDLLTAFEMIPAIGVDIACAHVPSTPRPFVRSHAWVVLLELCGQGEDATVPILESLLEDGIGRSMLDDAVVAQSDAQARAFWKLREAVVLAQGAVGETIKHDVSVAVSSVPEFLARVEPAVQARIPETRMLAFGHCGDGNVHCNFIAPPGMPAETFRARTGEVNRIVHDLVTEMRGSISAEHGIGQLKRAELQRYKSDVELSLMARLKAALDPRTIMNPGKVLPTPGIPDSPAARQS